MSSIFFEENKANAAFPTPLPVCDHYAGSQALMEKSLALQSKMAAEYQAVVFDVTLDAEDGAALGHEREHARMMADLVMGPLNAYSRVGVRVHAARETVFETEVELLLRHCGEKLAYLMLPKADSYADIEYASTYIRKTAQGLGLTRDIPLHALIETHGALQEVQRIAAHPHIESLSFGLMDFVSAHRGAIPASAMEVPGQFTHPLVARAKLDIAAAAHAFSKTPSHCVVTELDQPALLAQAARQASHEFGYTRMWSIHPAQIRPIIEAFAPQPQEIELASDILLKARQVDWQPIRYHTEKNDTLHDRASYRYFWQVLLRARQTGCPLSAEVQTLFFSVGEKC